MQGGNDYSYMISVMASSSLLMRQSHHLATIMFFAAAYHYHGRRRRRRRRRCRCCLVGAASRLSVVIFMPARQPMRSPHLLPRGDNGTLTIGKKMYKDNGRGYDVIEPK